MSDEKRQQTIDDDDESSREPSPEPGSSSYDGTLKSSSWCSFLPDLPDGGDSCVTWKQNPTNPKEWTLLRIDQQNEKDLYKLEPTITWNPNTGREQMIVKPVLKKKKYNDDDDDDDTSTVATSMSIGDVDIVDIDIDDNIVDDDQELIEYNAKPPPPPQPPKKEPPVLGVDYVIHTILPSSDTFSGLLLRYKINAVTLRRINQFSGTNLSLAPSQLVIPLTTDLTKNIKIQDVTSKEYKLQILLIDFPHLNIHERKAYLNMNDWDIELTKKQIHDDQDWEIDQIQKEQKIVSKLKSLS